VACHDEHVRRPATGPLRVGFYTDSGLVGGAEQGLVNLLRSLDDSVEATVVGPSGEVVAAIAAERPGTAAVVVPTVRHKRDLRAFARVAAAVRRLGLDVLHVHLRTPWAAQYGVAAGLLLPGVAVVLVENSPLPPSVPAQRAFKRITTRRVTAHVACGDWLAREVEHMAGLPAGSVGTIRYGIPEVELEPPPRPFAGVTAAVLARLVPDKGVHVLLRAAARVEGLSVVVVGDGPARGDLDLLVAELGMEDRVLFTGYVDDPRAWLRAVDLFVLPSFMEGLPLSPVEAMLERLPVVATTVGGMAEAVEDGATGLLVPPRDEAALADALAQLAGDAGRRAAMGEAGRRLALERFSIDRMAAAYLDLYRRAVA
jgi:glycosyltransferase involved in cell wall biosynthesis